MLTYADDEGEVWGIVHPTKVRYDINCGVEVKTPEGPRLKGVVMDVFPGVCLWLCGWVGGREGGRVGGSNR